jgi:hypothetical protein
VPDAAKERDERIRDFLSGARQSTDLRELFEERAAIIEFDGGFPREEAERRARLEVYKGRPADEGA